MPKFVHIDISADDPQRAADFYAKVFGWSVLKLEGPPPYWLIEPPESSEVGAGVAKREEVWHGVTPTIEVSSADAYTEKIMAEGGTIVVPKTKIPFVGHLVTFKDTEGNVMAVLEPADDDTPDGT